MATITINMLSGAVENENADFMVRFSEAALAAGHAVNIFLYGNGCNMANKEVPWTGEKGITEALGAHMDASRMADRIAALAARGASIHTCHTTEYGRGTEGCDYLDGVARGNVGVSLMKFWMTSDVAFTLG
ncbi:tRNA 2-thiouridine synthesizing protein D [Desulfobaculum xiamenense]|uniref:tRNA 2-thiouridine synthesizing protein D n=1 Tax=Desulfobaculum xiamenense TaxID=995050 RepID=A0A846QTM8_9BACT|nr:DsrE family protein [Desulfobaculum xiamenense]NJB67989.1 tRNA 2-thiouridine synthesizing protein D [Desulfobaculum xiamenense]